MEQRTLRISHTVGKETQHQSGLVRTSQSRATAVGILAPESIHCSMIVVIVGFATLRSLVQPTCAATLGTSEVLSDINRALIYSPQTLTMIIVAIDRAAVLIYYSYKRYVLVEPYSDGRYHFAPGGTHHCCCKYEIKQKMYQVVPLGARK